MPHKTQACTAERSRVVSFALGATHAPEQV